eukprot:134446-Pleurochrysis_carterae.AAC.2
MAVAIGMGMLLSTGFAGKHSNAYYGALRGSRRASNAVRSSEARPESLDDPPEAGTVRSDPWWSDGLRFSCSQCGNCCSGGEGFVYFTESEGIAMASRLGLSTEAFYAAYTKTTQGSLPSLHEKFSPGVFRAIYP